MKDTTKWDIGDYVQVENKIGVLVGIPEDKKNFHTVFVDGSHIA